MEFNYSKLRGKIREVFSTQDKFAEAMNLSNSSMSFKLNNKSEWSQQEINKAAKLLDITDDELVIYFFTLEV